MSRGPHAAALTGPLLPNGAVPPQHLWAAGDSLAVGDTVTSTESEVTGPRSQNLNGAEFVCGPTGFGAAAATSSVVALARSVGVNQKSLNAKYNECSGICLGETAAEIFEGGKHQTFRGWKSSRILGLLFVIII